MAEDKKNTKKKDTKPAPKQYVTVRTNPEKVHSRHAAFTTPDGLTVGREPVNVERTEFINSLLLRKHLLEG